MRRFPFVKRTIVSVLCVALLLTGNLSTMATEVGELLTEVTETTETMKGETVVATETESESETETETETESEPEIETETETETEIESEIETESEQEEVKTVNYTYENDDAIITVSAEEGVLPSEAELSVAPITSGDEYKEVKSQLENDAEENDYEIAGFLAYDICFLVNGEEVEPTGEVSVVIDYKEAAIPESVQNAEKTSVSIMHLEESNSQIEVKNISADSNVSVTSNNEVEKVEFTTETFSTFVITWRDGVQITVHYVNAETGEEISGTQSKDVPISENETISFSEYAGKINGYQYQNARLDNLWTGEEVTSVKATKETKNFLFWSSTTYYLTFYNESTEIDKVSNSCNVYLTYKDVSDQIETLDTSKNITINLFDYKANTANSSNEGVGTVKSNKTDGSGINYGHYLKFMNNCTNNDTNANSYTNGSTERRNIVANELDTDGYPVLSGNSDVWGKYSAGAIESLKYLFDETDIENAKKAYLGVNKLFRYDDEGYYVYDSAENFATIAGSEDNSFTVYDSAYAGFFPFTAKRYAYSSGCNTTNGDDLGSEYINHYFGMTIETVFIQPKDGKIDGKDMVFEFSGDDDVWVFIDGKLALDLGGIHSKASGSINFATGEVKAESGAVTTLPSIGISLDDYSVHTMNFFYLERGNQESNCKIKFNLQTVPKGSLSVSKNAIDVAEGDTSDYEFVLKDSNGVGVKNASYTIGTSSTVYSTDENGVFTLKNGQSAVFANLESGDYTVTETEVKNSNNAYKLSDFSTRVSVNGGELTTITAASEKPRMATVTVSDAHTSSVDFRNLLIKEEVNETNSVLSKVIRHDDVDNDYDLTLSFKGPKQELTKTEYEENTSVIKAKVDIVLVMDVSGSMDGDNLSNSKNAVSNMVGAIKAKEQTVDARWKLVTFSSCANIVTSDWVNSDTLLSNVKSINNPTGGTNYQHGLVKAQTAVSEKAREDATQIVIFITDGEPTFHLCSTHDNCYYNSDSDYQNCNHYKKLSNDGNVYCGGADETYRADYEGSIMGAQALYCDTFYAVGIGLQDDVYRLGGTWIDGIDLLTNVANAVNATTKSAVNKKPSELGSLFSNIAGEIITESESHITKTYKYASKVTLTDTLSEYVDIVEDSAVVISVKNAEGKEVGTCTSGKLGASDASYTFKDGESDVTLTASYSNKVVTLNFPEDYELDEDYTYAVTFTVKASETAYNEYAKNGYTNVGAANTDAEGNETSSGKQGFNSNTEAKVTYSFDGEEKTENFDHPVIQVDVAKLILVKHNEKGESLSGVTFTLYKDTDTTGVAKTTSEDGTLDFGYLTSGSYRLLETAAPDKYALLDEKTQALTFRVSKGVITFEDEVDTHWTLPTEAATTSITAGEGESAIVNTSENAYSVTVYNELARIYEWNIYKISASSTSDNMIYLEGAEFTLSSDDHTYYGKSGNDGKITWYSDDEYTTVVEEVVAGTYTLKETLAPTGYTINEDWTLVIGLDNNISGFDQSNASYDEATKTYTIYYEDEALYSLPATGGTGIFAYMFGGMFLMMAGALYIFMCRRKAYRA